MKITKQIYQSLLVPNAPPETGGIIGEEIGLSRHLYLIMELLRKTMIVTFQIFNI